MIITDAFPDVTAFIVKQHGLGALRNADDAERREMIRDVVAFFGPTEEEIDALDAALLQEIRRTAPRVGRARSPDALFR